MNTPDGTTSFAGDHARRIQEMNPLNLPTRSSLPAPSLAAMSYGEIVSDAPNAYGALIVDEDQGERRHFTQAEYEAMGRGQLEAAHAPRPSHYLDGADRILARTRTIYSDSNSGLIDNDGRRYFVTSRDEENWGTYVTSQESAVKAPNMVVSAAPGNEVVALPPVADGNLAAVQALTPRQVFELRQAGDPVVIGGRHLRSTDLIATAVGYAPGDMARLTPAQVAGNLDAVQPFVTAANARYTNLPPDLLNAVIAYESRGMPNAVSGTGALGIMQITSQNYLPGNYNPFIPELAVNAGGKMLSQYIDKYGSGAEGINKTVAAYNQGPGAVDAAVRQGGADWTKVLAPEGQRYITNIQLIRDGVYFRRPIPGYFGSSR